MNRRCLDRAAFTLGAILLITLGGGATGAPAATGSWSCKESSEVVLGSEAYTLPAPVGGFTAPVVIEEMGAEAMLSIDDGAFEHLSYPMTRYAWRWLDQRSGATQIRLRAGSTAKTSVRIHLDCQLPDAHRQSWLDEAQRLAASIDRHVQADPALADFDQLVDSAIEAADQAAARHMRALVRFLKYDYLGAAQEYAETGPLWLALGDRTRAGGAYLGAADVYERAGRAGEAEAMLAQAEPLLDPATDAYFLARIKLIRCNKFQTEGRLQEVIACTTDVVARYRRIGEIDEAIYLAGQLLIAFRDTGDKALIDKALADIDSDPAVAQASWQARGYLALMRSYVQRDRGQLLSALTLIGDSLRAFERATEGRERWQASALLQAADIYGQLGMSEQAYRLLAQAISLYDATAAPDRIAAALMKLAILDRNNARVDVAATWYRRAEHIYALLGRPVERADAELGLLETRLPETASEARDQLRQQRDWTALSAANLGRLALLQVRWMISAGEFKQARKLLDSSQNQTGAVPQRLLAARLHAELELQQGRHGKALALLENELRQLQQMAAHSSTGTLGYLAMLAGRELRADWVRIALADPKPPSGDDWWRVLVASAPLQSVRPGEHSGDDSFSLALSLELQGIGSSDASDRAMLSTLTQNAGTATATQNPLPSAADLLAQLGSSWLLLVVPSEPQSAAVWIGEQRSMVAPIPGRGELRDQIRQLAAALESPSEPVAEIKRSAEVLSASLFAGAPEPVAPQRLLVLSDELIGTVPLSLLRWPGAERTLIDTTTSGWVARFDLGTTTDSEHATIHTIVAPGNASTERVGLAKLRYAEQEADLIAKTEPQRELIRASDARATRTALLSALSDPQAWVHLAAHGYAKPELLGYAGTWLASADTPGKSEFLSWLDIIDTPLHAQLAVLNACQLAAGPGATSQSSLSFASAVAAAGVDNVVAAFWPISDSASAIWIPAFYSAMREQPASYSIEALRTAQLALKGSRAYRHPYYWASLAHFQRMTIKAAANSQ